MMQTPLVIDGGILAGGLATRMQGQDKGLQLYQNKRLVEWVYQSLAPHVRKVIINCNRNHDVYGELSPFICSDSIKGFPGPLAGLISLMENSDADYFLVSPCDTPKLTQQYAQKMLAFLKQQLSLDQKHPQLFAVTTDTGQHPLHLCISRFYQPSLENYLAKGEHRVMKWMSDNKARWVDFSAHSCQFQNYNSLDDLIANE